MSPFIVFCYYDFNSSLSNKCVASTSTLATVYLMTRVILYYFSVPIILAIFGTLTINNIRAQRRPVVAAEHQADSRRRLEDQLNRMLVIQVAVYFLFFAPAGITYILVTFVPAMNTSYYNTIRNITVV